MTVKGKRRVSCDDMGWDDEFKKGAWTNEEDAVLRAAVYVSSRHASQSSCASRHSLRHCVQASHFCAVGWADWRVTTRAEAAQRQGRPGNWTDISRDIPGRSGKSCRLRWCNQLDPAVKKVPFSDWEDAVIIRGWQARRIPALVVLVLSRVCSLSCEPSCPLCLRTRHVKA